MKVLVVDDSMVFRTAISVALDSSDDIDRVETAVNGKEALDRIIEKEDIE